MSPEDRAREIARMWLGHDFNVSEVLLRSAAQLIEAEEIAAIREAEERGARWALEYIQMAGVVRDVSAEVAASIVRAAREEMT